MKCKNPQCDNEVIAKIAGHDLCVDCYNQATPLTATEIVQREITYWAQQGFEDKMLTALQQGNKRADRNQFATAQRMQNIHGPYQHIMDENDALRKLLIGAQALLLKHGIIGGAK